MAHLESRACSHPSAVAKGVMGSVLPFPCPTPRRTMESLFEKRPGMMGRFSIGEAVGQSGKEEKTAIPGKYVCAVYNWELAS